MWECVYIFLDTTKDLDMIGEVSALEVFEGSKFINKILIVIVFVTKWGFDQGYRKAKKL